MRQLRFIHALAVCAALTLLATDAAAADTFQHNGDTISVGGDGGGEFRDVCPAGQALVGLNLTVGKDLDSVAAVCAAFMNGAQLRGELGLATRGRPTDRGDGVRCFIIGGAVQALHVEVSRHGQVHFVQLHCRNLQNGTAGTPTRNLFTQHGESVREDWANCGGGAVAIGIHGRYGAMVDRIGLVCGIHAVPQAQPAPVQLDPIPAKPIPRRNEPLPVGNGGGDNGGGNGRANTDTTIYDDPGGNDLAYLSVGDPVRIVQCGQPESWCQISAPTAGWVWGPELDR